MSKQIVDNITKGNKIIGKFMNLEEGKVISGKPIFIIDGSFYQYGHLEYHSSWDWLMPVVEKIEMEGYDTGICGVEIKGEKLTEVLITPIKKGNDKIEIHSRNSVSKINLTWQVVTQFISWYNSQPKNIEQ